MIVMHVRVVPVPALFSMSTRVVLEKYEDDDDTIEGVPCLRLRCQNDETILVATSVLYYCIALHILAPLLLTTASKSSSSKMGTRT